jgi:hypothetical protein
LRREWHPDRNVFGHYQAVCFESQQRTDEQVGQPQEKSEQQDDVNEATQSRTPAADVVWQTIDAVLLAQAVDQ